MVLPGWLAIGCEPANALIPQGSRMFLSHQCCDRVDGEEYGDQRKFGETGYEEGCHHRLDDALFRIA